MTREQASPLDIYKLLPKTNCGKCGERNCLAFAAKIASRAASPSKCSPLAGNTVAFRRLEKLLEPPVKEVLIGSGTHTVRIGGKLVMYRHELTYSNPTAIAIDITDEMPQTEILDRLARTEGFCFEHVGQKLKLDLIGIRSTSNDPAKFGSTARAVAAKATLPLILLSLNPKIIEAGLSSIPSGSRPLLYAATNSNWKEMADYALTYRCPLVIHAPNDLQQLRSLVRKVSAHGVEDLVLDPGTFSNDGLRQTISSFTLIREAACKKGDKLLGYPLMGVPLIAWLSRERSIDELSKWHEAYLASMLIVRFADILLLHNIDGWALLPVVMLRQNLYTDPQKPSIVQPGLRAFGKPNENSPVMFTTNFALTFHTVASDIEKAKLDAYLLVVDTEGIAVDSAVAGRKLTADKISLSLKKYDVENKVKHRMLIIPGKASRLSQEIEKITGWQVLVGPTDSSSIPRFIQEKWQKTA